MADAPHNPPPIDAQALRRIAVVAALAVALGLVVQALVVVAKFAFDGMPGPAALAANVAGGVTWSVLVCAGAAIGTSIARVGAFASAVVAALFAPLAVAASRAASQTLSAAIGAAAKPAAGSLIALAALKSVEYGLLGFLLATLAQRGVARIGPYLGAGAAIGVVFGAVAIALRAATGVPVAELAATAVNEIAFPIGCAGVVYAGVIASRAALTSATD